jgi:hypothetical protein
VCGSVYAGGFFTSVNGEKRHGLALLDAASGAVAAWAPNADGPIIAMAEHDGALYVSGLFGSIGGQLRNRLASLDPVTGNATAWNPDSDNLVEAFAADGGTIYAGGSFTTLGGASVSCLAGIQAGGSLSCPAMTLTPSALVAGRVGQAYARTLSVVGGTGPYCYDVTSGALPLGLSLNPSSGQISGTPSSAMSYAFTVTALTTTGCTAGRSYVLLVRPACQPFAFVPDTLPAWPLGSGVSQPLDVQAATPPAIFSVASGTLPPGVTLSPSGVLSGTPSAAGTWQVTILARDPNLCQGSHAYTMTVLQTTDVPLDRERTVFLAATPNPARGAVTVDYALARAGPVTLGVYEVGGRRVRTLVDAVQAAGTYGVPWDGRDDFGHAKPPGAYHVLLEADGRRMTRALVLLR